MDVYDEVDRRENDAGEPGGHGSLGQRGQRTCQPGRAGTWVALSPGLGRGTWLGLLSGPAREPRQLGAQQPALLADGQSCPEEAASLLLSPAPWTGAPLRPAAALSGSLPSRAPPPPSLLPGHSRFQPRGGREPLPPAVSPQLASPSLALTQTCIPCPETTCVPNTRVPGPAGLGRSSEGGAPALQLRPVPRAQPPWTVRAPPPQCGWRPRTTAPW